VSFVFTPSMGVDRSTKNNLRRVALASIASFLAMAMLVASGGPTAASVGCTSWSQIPTITLPASGLTLAGVGGPWSAGDTLTITATPATNITGPPFTLIADQNTSRTVYPSGGTITFIVQPSEINHVMVYQVTTTAAGPATISFACAPVAPPGPTDSQKIRSMQILGSSLVAQTSGAAITGAINGAIANGFSQGSTPITITPNGMTFNFAADPQNGADLPEAIRALGYMPTKPVPITTKDWMLWSDVRGTSWNTNAASGDLKGNQLNVTGGITHSLTSDLLIGIFAGYENFNYDVASLTGKLNGDGGTIGAYTAYRFSPILRADLSIAWSSLSYNLSAGAVSGSFNAGRWLVSGGLTGTYEFGAYIFEPSISAFALRESENAFTDSTGIAQAARDFSVGRASVGGKIAYPFMLRGWTLTPYAGIYGDYRFSSDNALPVGIPILSVTNGLSARVTSGITFGTVNGATLGIGGEVGGLGSGAYTVWSAKALASVRF
jgi:hypothetical protein